MTIRAAFAVTLAALAGCAAPTSQANPASVSAALSPVDQRFAADFDAFMTRSLARLPMVPAVAVAIVRSDRPLYLKAFGRADVEAGTPATVDSRFYIASSTKSFMALALARLAAEGRISLDWTLAQLAPGVAFAPEIEADKVTLRHLLSHSHGLLGEAIEFRLAYSGEHDAATLWRLLGTMKRNKQAPLGTFEYSNLGYNVAALLVERRLGRRWQDLMEEEVLRPLRLTESVVQGLERERRRAVFAAPYFSAGPAGIERLALVKVDSTMQSAGGMFSSARDMARWTSVQLAAEKNAPGLAVPASVVVQTHRPAAKASGTFGPFARAAYGLGWYSGDYQGETLYHSFGGYTGARAHVSFMPGRDIGVAVMTNDDGAGNPFVDVAAAYAYDWYLLGPEAARQRADEMLARIEAQAARRAAALAADRATRAKRSWLLTQPLRAYSGRYCNADMGTIAVSPEGERMRVRMGNLSALAEPFTKPDAVRLELIPLEGQPVQFALAGGKAASLTAFGRTFERC
jgi:CubicO group peptidase (beta-lactamase class C family)